MKSKLLASMILAGATLTVVPSFASQATPVSDLNVVEEQTPRANADVNQPYHRYYHRSYHRSYHGGYHRYYRPNYYGYYRYYRPYYWSGNTSEPR